MGLLYGNSPAPTQTQSSGGLLGNLSDHVAAYNASPIPDTIPNASDNVPSIPYQKIPGTTTPNSGGWNKIGTYARAFETSPGTALSRIWNGQGISRVDNGAIISARMPLSQSSKIKQNMGGNTVNGQTSQLDHVTPLELGGTNQQKNLKNITKAQDDAQGVMENYLGQALKGNLIDAKTAQTLMSQYKNGQIDENGVIAGVKANPLQHQNLLQKAVHALGTAKSGFEQGLSSTPTGRAMNSFTQAMVQSERTAATGIARVLPGGTNDIKAQQAAAQSADNNTKTILGLMQSGKINPTVAKQLLQENAYNASSASNDLSNTIKQMPTRGQVAAGFGGVAADILTGGTLPELKGALTIANVANKARVPASFATDAALNAGAGGGTKKQILENAVAGAVFPLALKGVAKVATGTKSLLSSAIDKAQAAKSAGTPLPASALDAHVAQAEQLAKDAQKTAPTRGNAPSGALLDKNYQAPQVGKIVETPTTAPKTSVAQSNDGLTKAEIGIMAKQNFTPDVINKLHTDAGGKIGDNGVAIPSDSKVSTGIPIVKTPTSYGDIVPQTSSERKITSLTSISNRLNRLGDSGKAALQTIRDKEIGARVHTQQLSDMAKPFMGLSEKEQAVAIKVHKGEYTTTNPRIQAGADSLRTMFQSAHQRATSAGLGVGNQGANYFPQSYPSEWFKNPKSINKAAQQLVAQGKAPDLETAIGKLNKIKIEGSVNSTTYGHFKARTTDIPGIENAKVVRNYIRGSSDAIAAAEHFGSKNINLKAHIADAIKKGEDATALKNIISSYTHPPRAGNGVIDKTLGNYQKALRVIQLPRAVISHGPQPFANTASDIGYKQFFKAMGEKMKLTPADEKFLHDNGFRSEKLAPPEGLAGKATAPGLAPYLAYFRDVAALGGKNVAIGHAVNGDIPALKAMGVSGDFVKDASGKIKLSEAQMAQAGHFEANKSMGSSSPLESPAWTGTTPGKAIGMYRKMYTFKQAERIGNWFSDARKGNVAPLLKYLAIGSPVAGLTVAVTKDEIKNPGSNPLSDPKKLALDTLHNSGLGAIGYGAVDSTINAISHNYGNNSRWSNAASFVAPAAGFAVQTGQNIDKGVRGNWNPLVRQGIQSLPVGGTTLANKFAPSGSATYQAINSAPDVQKTLKDAGYNPTSPPTTQRGQVLSSGDYKDFVNRSMSLYVQKVKSAQGDSFYQNLSKTDQKSELGKILSDVRTQTLNDMGIRTVRTTKTRLKKY